MENELNKKLTEFRYENLHLKSTIEKVTADCSTLVQEVSETRNHKKKRK